MKIQNGLDCAETHFLDDEETMWRVRGTDSFGELSTAPASLSLLVADGVRPLAEGCASACLVVGGIKQ